MDLVLCQGSASGVTVGVKVLLSKFKASHGLVLSVLFPISFSNFSVWFWVVFLIRWVDFWWDFQNYGFCFGGDILLARDWNLHIIDSLVVGAIVGVS